MHVQFKEQVGLLTRAGASCISYDMLGAGRSSKPRPATPEGRLAAYSPDEHYQDLKALLDMLLKKRVSCADAAGSILPVVRCLSDTSASQSQNGAQQLLPVAFYRVPRAGLQQTRPVGAAAALWLPELPSPHPPSLSYLYVQLSTDLECCCRLRASPASSDVPA